MINIRSNILFSLITFCIILISFDSYWFGASSSHLMYMLNYVFLVILAIIFIIKKPDEKALHTNNVIIIGFVCFALLLSVLFNSDSLLGGTTIIIIEIITALLIVKKTSFDKFSDIFIDIIFLLTLYSLIIYAFIFVGILSPNILYNMGDNPVYSCAGCVFYKAGDFYRNSCIFREPGMYMIYINLCIILKLIRNQKMTIWQIIVFSLGIFSSFSTAGIIVLFMMLIIYMLNMSKKHNKIKYIVVLAIIVYLVLASEFMNSMVFHKFSESEDNASFLARISSVLIPSSIFLDNPLLGCGFANFEKEYMNHSIKLYGFNIGTSNSTNTIFNTFAVLGVIPGSFILFSLYKFSKKIRKAKLLLFVGLLLMFSNESMFYSIILYIILLYGLKGFLFKKKICI